MIKKIKALFVSLAASSALLVPLAVPAVVSAQNIEENLCSGANFQLSGNADCDEAAAEERLDNIITTVINVLSLVVGVVAVIMIIIGGFRYILSGGDSGNVTSAKNTIIFAIVGLVIVALAQIIVRFVLSRVGGTA